MSGRDGLVQTAAVTGSGMLFGFGLAWATMIRPESILAFLTFHDLGLLVVLGVAVTLNLIVFQVAPRLMRQPLLGGGFQGRPFTLNRQRLAGGVIFGLGWGISGICPGPALAGAGAGQGEMLLALAGIGLGALIHGLLAGRGGVAGEGE